MNVPDRAAALRDVETLLRRIHDVGRYADPNDIGFWLDANPGVVGSLGIPRRDLAALIVDRVLGVEQDGEKP